MGMSDFAFSAKMRDIVISIVTETVNKIRPPDRYGVVDTIDAANKKVGVILNGETGAILLPMGSIKPTAVGQQVRVSGGFGDRYISDVFGSVQDCPIGTIVMWYANNTPPTGWLLCNGATFSATNYPLLNTLLGGNTLPNLVDRFPIGASGSPSAKAVKSTGGSATAALDWNHVPQHVHTGVDHLHGTGNLQKTVSLGNATPVADNGGGSVAQGATAGRFVGTQSGGTTTGAADRSLTTGVGNQPVTPFTGLASTGNAFSTLNPYMALNFIIRGA